MPFPGDSTTPGEEVHLHTRRHWHTVVWPGLLALALAVTFGYVSFVLLGAQLGMVLFGLLSVVFLSLLVPFAIWPFAVWRATQFAFTGDRIMMREGVFRVRNSDVPLNRLDNVSSEQGLLDRMLSCGTLRLGPTSDPNANKLEHIPNVKDVQILVNVLIRGVGHNKGADVTVLERVVGKLTDGARPSTAPPKGRTGS